MGSPDFFRIFLNFHIFDTRGGGHHWKMGKTNISFIQRCCYRQCSTEWGRSTAGGKRCGQPGRQWAQVNQDSGTYISNTYACLSKSIYHSYLSLYKSIKLSNISIFLSIHISLHIFIYFSNLSIYPSILLSLLSFLFFPYIYIYLILNRSIYLCISNSTNQYNHLFIITLYYFLSIYLYIY